MPEQGDELPFDWITNLLLDLKPPRLSPPRDEIHARRRARPPKLATRPITKADVASFVSKPQCVHGELWNVCAECDP